MIILRQDVIDEEGPTLLKKLAAIWTQFYTSILPTLQAMFSPVQLENLTIRGLSLLTFRDVVLLKTQINAALKSVSLDEVPPQIRQMLLVLQGIHRTPPSEDYFTLVTLLPHVVKPYQCLVPRIRNQNEAESGRLSRAETVSGRDSPSVLRSESPAKRRHSYTMIPEVEAGKTAAGSSPFSNKQSPQSTNN
jgi:hypothetical protein